MKKPLVVLAIVVGVCVLAIIGNAMKPKAAEQPRVTGIQNNGPASGAAPAKLAKLALPEKIQGNQELVRILRTVAPDATEDRAHDGKVWRRTFRYNAQRVELAIILNDGAPGVAPFWMMGEMAIDTARGKQITAAEALSRFRR